MYSTESEGGTLRRSDRLRSRLSASSASSSGQNRSSNERSRSLPRHYQQSRLLSTSTLDLSSASYDYRQDTLYVTKGVAFICAEPIVQVAQQVLMTMYKYICKSDYDIQVKYWIIWFFFKWRLKTWWFHLGIRRSHLQLAPWYPHPESWSICSVLVSWRGNDIEHAKNSSRTPHIWLQFTGLLWYSGHRKCNQITSLRTFGASSN